MAKYRCSVCGYIYDQEKEGAPFSALSECPVCHQPASAFQLYEYVSDTGQERKPERKLDYAKEYYRTDESCRYMERFTRWRSAGNPSRRPWGRSFPCPPGMIF